ncbi:MAG TPA: trypsin-like peptidase domain-containing protein [Candidatus Rifleibacterium sp.]|nr:trypsin-like peptidase domain-containing protein [Candidatus Rifleibacterium sp.]HPT44803.1 trypsin-like peptidase domain-containing protein [Candidatus Rifleibacterium sp.]
MSTRHHVRRCLPIIFSFVMLFSFAGKSEAAPAELFGTSLIADIAERVSPAVVAIESLQYVRARRRTGSGDPFFDQFFGHLFDDDFSGHNNVIPKRGNGSGVIISPEGHLLTNEHVIADADEILVNLGNGKTLKASIIGKDTLTDLAVLKIDSDTALPHIPIGDSSNMRVGEWVIAIGNPFGLGITVTSGVVSAINRDLSVDRSRSYKDLIQTDASINPGNSGGALINSRGELVGVNTAIIPYGQGIGFAIPVNRAKRIIGDLMAYGRVKKAFLGVSVQKITPELAKYFEIPLEGVLVTDVAKNSTAEKAQLVPGDVIIEIEGRKIRNTDDFQEGIDEHRVGDKAKIKIYRKGKEGIAEVEFNENPAGKNPLGVTVSSINGDLVRRFHLYVEEGCVVTSVIDGSPAARAGLQPGDVIQQVDRKVTLNEEAFEQAITVLVSEGRSLLRVVRGQTVNLLLVTTE